MTGSTEREWEQMIDEWRGESAPARSIHEDLVRKARAARIRLAILAAGEGLVGAAFLAVSAAVAWGSADPPTLAWAAAVWFFTFAALGFSFWNRRGGWRPAARTTRAYLDFSRERCRRTLRAVRFGWLLLAAELVFLAGWFGWVYVSGPRSGGEPERYAFTLLLIALVSAAVAAWLLVVRRRARREMRGIETTSASLDSLDGSD